MPAELFLRPFGVLLAIAISFSPASVNAQTCSQEDYCPASYCGGAAWNAGLFWDDPSGLLSSLTTQTQRFQRALDCAAECAAECGASVVVPGRDSYVQSDYLSIDTGVTMRGQGMGISVLERVGGGIILKNKNAGGSGDTDVHIQDLTFRGGGVSARFSQLADFTIARCEFESSASHGLHIQSAGRNGVISGCAAHDNGGDGFRVEDLAWPEPSEAVSFVGCHAHGNGTGAEGGHGFAIIDSGLVGASGCIATSNLYGAGFYIQSSSQVSLAGCISEDNSIGFASAGGPGGASTDIVFSSCIACQNSSHGFHVTWSEHVAINGCHARENDGYGIRLESADSSEMVKHFSIEGGTVLGNDSWGLLIEGGQHGTVSAVVIADNANGTTDSRGIGARKASGDSITRTQHLMVTGCVFSGHDFALIASGDNLGVFANDVSNTNSSPSTNCGDPICLYGSDNALDCNPGQ